MAPPRRDPEGDSDDDDEGEKMERLAQIVAYERR